MGNSENGIVRMSGRYLFQANGVATMAAIGLNPLNMDARLVTVSDAWLEYRFTRARCKAWPITGTTSLCLAYNPGLVTTSPTTQDQLTTLQQFAIGNGSFGCPFPALKLGLQALMGPSPMKWFRRGTGYDDLFETQGQLWFYNEGIAFNTLNVFVLVEYEVEFRSPAATALTLPELSTDPSDLAKQLFEVCQVLGMEDRIRSKRPPPIEPQEVKEAEDEEYTAVLVKSPVVASTPRPQQVAGVPVTPKPRVPR